ncbi:Cof-type HAD-IIB family hydrolase [Mahella australiensis]|uniref:Cof-like hydrolase n=1 Tax=Mahella australiensis (strain DSM 15567 / CIP 107919 / 50-1 BON) TaxID=697281 RepID=F4A3B6_MAHA5|nr:Cof-type HAD-IIB family hydrolase [Mahella australiensis]AEE97371.1 Cof-like hydrolase [Mahella australiensis 50-1 BON]
MQYELIVADMDGTLLNDKKEISPKNREYIEKYRKAGGLFTIATGRGRPAVEDIVKEININIPVIVYNGAQLYDFRNKKAIYEAFLDQKAYTMALVLLHKLNITFLAYQGPHMWVERISPVILKHLAKENIKINNVTAASIDTFPTEGINKILTITEQSDFDEFAMLFSQAGLTGVRFVQSEVNYFEILPEGVSKGHALEELAAYLDIPLSQTAAIGDHMNDIEMLRAAGLGVAMANARDEVKRCARFITKSNNDDGVAYFIELLLKDQIPN